MLIFKVGIPTYPIKVLLMCGVFGCTDQTKGMASSEIDDSLVDSPILYRIPQVDSTPPLDLMEDQSLFDIDQEPSGRSEGGFYGGHEGGSNLECPPLNCNQSCSDGYLQDDTGCFICECVEFMGVACFTDEDCFSFETCRDGYCQNIEPNSMTPIYCMGHSDCPTALLCVEGICQ